MRDGSAQMLALSVGIRADGRRFFGRRTRVVESGGTWLGFARTLTLALGQRLGDRSHPLPKPHLLAVKDQPIEMHYTRTDR